MTDFDRAMEFLKDCVNWNNDNSSMKVTIAGERGDRIISFIKEMEKKKGVERN